MCSWRQSFVDPTTAMTEFHVIVERRLHPVEALSLSKETKRDSGTENLRWKGCRTGAIDDQTRPRMKSIYGSADCTQRCRVTSRTFFETGEDGEARQFLIPGHSTAGKSFVVQNKFCYCPYFETTTISYSGTENCFYSQVDVKMLYYKWSRDRRHTHHHVPPRHISRCGSLESFVDTLQ